MPESGKILVLGVSGQLGSALAELLGERGVAADQEDADFTRAESLAPLLDTIRPVAVINAAAYTAVDRAEHESVLADAINGTAPGVLARWCASNGVPFVHYSTDYVFDGTGERPWTETDRPAPLNAYGRSKLAGERAVAAAGGRWLVLRTSWVYDAVRPNFLTTMLRLGGEREEIDVVADQIGAPTYAGDLAAGTLAALDHARATDDFPSGIYHLCNVGETSWHGFAEEIFRSARGRGVPIRVRTVRPIPTTAYPAPARRPINSRLNTDKAARTLGVRLPHWRRGLEHCMQTL